MFIDGSPHAVTNLWDVGAHHLNLKFTCGRCGHSRVFHAAAVWWLFRQRGWNEHLSQVRQRFVCGACWAAHRVRARAPRMEVVKEDHEAPSLPLPPEREWKQESKRRR
jgi:ribosomal protein S27AE